MVGGHPVLFVLLSSGCTSLGAAFTVLPKTRHFSSRKTNGQWAKGGSGDAYTNLLKEFGSDAAGSADMPPPPPPSALEKSSEAAVATKESVGSAVNAAKSAVAGALPDLSAPASDSADRSPNILEYVFKGDLGRDASNAVRGFDGKVGIKSPLADNGEAPSLLKYLRTGDVNKDFAAPLKQTFEGIRSNLNENAAKSLGDMATSSSNFIKGDVDYLKGKVDGVISGVSGPSVPSSPTDTPFLFDLLKKTASEYDQTKVTALREKTVRSLEQAAQMAQDASAVAKKGVTTESIETTKKAVGSAATAIGGYVSSSAKATLESGAASAPAVGATASKAAAAVSGVAATVGFGEIAATLRLEEFGGWYVAAAAILFAFTQRAEGRKEAEKEFSKKLGEARQQAEEATEASAAASADAAKARSTAKELEETAKAKVGSANAELMLEKGRSRLAGKRKASTRVEIEQLEKEISRLKTTVAKLQDAQPPESKDRAIPTNDEARAQALAYASELSADDSEFEASQKRRILDLLKEIEEENRAAKPQVTKKVTAEVKPKKPVTKKGAAEVKPKKPVTKKVVTEVKPNKPVVAEAAEEPVEEPVVEEAAEEPVAEPEPVEEPEPVAKKAEAVDSEWASFTDSTLMRKTVAQLTDYLEARKVSVVGSDGKKLKKAELVDAVKNMVQG